MLEHFSDYFLKLEVMTDLHKLLDPDTDVLGGGEVGSRGPKGPSRWPKATSPPQELEVGAHRAPYLLVADIGTMKVSFRYGGGGIA